MTRALLVLVLIQAFTYWEVLKLLIAEPLRPGGLVAFFYFVLTIGSVMGLLLRSVWGFYGLYALIPFATVMLSIRFVPLQLTFLPLSQRWIGLVILNGVVLVLAALGHYWFRRPPRYAPGGAA